MNNSNYIEQIGLVIWGCKGGYKPCLFSNNVVNVQDGDIAQTVLDIRKYVRFLRPNIDFYALEFTPKYRVFTKYRSSNDSGDGAFIAITIYIPHELQFNNVRTALDELMTAYWREYMDVVDGRHMQGKYYDIAIMQSIIDAHAADITQETGKFKKGKSKRTETPQLLLYGKLEEVDFYFSTPYRESFRNSQEITFLSRESLDPQNADDFRPVIADYLHIIEAEEIGDQEPESLLLPFNVEGVTLERLIIDGQDCLLLAKTQGCPLAEGQTIEMEFSKPHCVNYTCSITTENAIEQGILLKSDRNYKISSRIPFEWKKKTIVFRCLNPSCNEAKLKDLLLLSGSDGMTRPLSYDGEKLTAIFQGEAIEHKQELYLRINKVSNDAKILNAFIPSEQTEVLVDVAEMEIKVSKDSVVRGDLEIKIKCSFREEDSSVLLTYKDSKAFVFYLPRPFADIAEYEFEVPRHKCNFDRNNLILTLEPEFTQVGIDTSDLDKFVKLTDITLFLTIGSEEFKSRNDAKSKTLFFVLPYRWQEMTLGALKQANGYPVDYDIAGKSIVVKGRVVTNNCRSAQRFSLVPTSPGDLGFDNIQIESGKCFFFGSTYEIDEEQELPYLVNQNAKDKNLTYFVLEPKASVKDKLPLSTVGNNQSDGTEEKGQPITIYLYSCDSYYFKDKRGLVSINKCQEVERGEKKCRKVVIQGGVFHICDKEKNDYCTIHFPKGAYDKNQINVQSKRENGFRVEWDNQACHVYYEPSVMQRMRNFIGGIKKNLGKMLLVLFPVCAILGLGYYYLFHNRDISNDKRLCVTFVGNVERIKVDSKEFYYEVKDNVLLIKDSLGVKDVRVELYSDETSQQPDSIYTLSEQQLSDCWKNNRHNLRIDISLSLVGEEEPVVEVIEYTDEDRQNDERLIRNIKAIFVEICGRNTCLDKLNAYRDSIEKIKDPKAKEDLKIIGDAFEHFFVTSFKIKKKYSDKYYTLFDSYNQEFKASGYKYLSEANQRNYNNSYGADSASVDSLLRIYDSVAVDRNNDKSPNNSKNPQKGTSGRTYLDAKERKKKP